VRSAVDGCGVAGLVCCLFLAGGGGSAWAPPAWLAPQDLSAAGQDAYDPQVAFDGQGNAIAVWSRSNGTNFIVQTAARAAGGSFGASQDLSAAGQKAAFAQVAVDGQGNAIAVWSRFDGTNFVVQAAARAAASRRRRRYFTPKRGGSFGAPQDLSAAGQNASFPEVVFDGQGNAIAVWRRFDGTNFIVQAAVRAAGGSFGAPQDLSAAGQTANDPQVAVGGQGNAIAVWSRSNGTNDIVQAAVRAGGSFGAAQDLSAAGQDAHVPEVAVDWQGNAIAVWSRSNGTNYIVQAVVRTAGPQTAALAS
jgi:hypothetical protein